MKRKRRSVASYRAASLKAARTRRRMKERREAQERHDRIRNLTYAAALLETARNLQAMRGGRFHLDDILPPEPTINRIPKVEWP